MGLELKILTLPFDYETMGFKNEKVEEVLKSKSLVSVKEHFFEVNNLPHLTLILLVQVPTSVDENVTKNKTKSNPGDEPWKKIISESELGLFNLLREWRSKRSKKDGLPPYILFTNEQLAHITKKRPLEISELKKIHGVGEAKAAKYGEEIINILKIEPPMGSINE